MAVVATDPYVVLQDNVDVSKAALQALLAEINTRLGEIPLSPASIDVGMMVVYADNGLGPSPASAGSRAISCANRQFGNFGPLPVEIDGNVTITNALHFGNLLLKKSSGASVVTMNLHPNPTVGISTNFACTILRYQGSGTLQIVSGMTNQHAESHTRVLEGGMVTIYVDSDVGWFLKGETEA